MKFGRIMFWAQLDPKINIWSFNHPYLSPRLKQSMKIKMKNICLSLIHKIPLTPI